MKTQESTPLQGSNVTFNHKTYVGEHGEVLYDMPLDAEDIDLKDFNATAKDLVTLRYNGTDNIMANVCFRVAVLYSLNCI